MGIYSQE